MATVRHMEFSRMMNGNFVPVLHGREAASQTFKAGAVLALDANNDIVKAGADPANILGIALEDASNRASAGGDLAFIPAVPGAVFQANVRGTGAANNIQQTDFMKKFGLVEMSGGEWVVDKDDTTNTRVKIVSFIDPVGEVNGRVEFIFLDANNLWTN
jgi:hypothetical protein